MTDIIGAAKPALVDIAGRPIPKVGAAPELPIEERAKLLPEPSGYRLLCGVPDVEERTDLVEITDIIQKDRIQSGQTMKRDTFTHVFDLTE